jgi:hypothetical protein
MRQESAAHPTAIACTSGGLLLTSFASTAQSMIGSRNGDSSGSLEADHTVAQIIRTG